MLEVSDVMYALSAPPPPLKIAVSNPEMVFSLREGKEDVSVNNLIVELTINPPEREEYPVPA